ncbi:MAG: hypothetical protein M1813_003895 [Trichoglossum hirsutum]|nr:MAG: hypothetical protein M1813_003895 [Trichoglossum hirsutum]
MNPEMQGQCSDNSGYPANTEVETWKVEDIEMLYDVRTANGVTYYEIKEQFKDAGHPLTIVISSDNNAAAYAYLCLICECTSSRKADLERHYNTHHGPQPERLDCPKRKCARKGENGFTRKDHLGEHMRNFHMEKLPRRPCRNHEDL